jgi:hypothetical protein
MKRPRVLIPMVIGIALVCMTTFSEAQSKIIQVTATDGDITFLGTPTQTTLGDSNLGNFKLTDTNGNPAGTLAVHCTIVSVPPRDHREQCLLTANLSDGQILFGGFVPLPAPGVSAEFGILGGTGQFNKVQGVVFGFVNPAGPLEFTFALD